MKKKVQYEPFSHRAYENTTQETEDMVSVDAPNADSSIDVEPPSLVITKEYDSTGYLDKILPVVIYVADWIRHPTSSQGYSTTVHISLLERKRGTVPLTNPYSKKNQYWLRIGALVESNGAEDLEIQEKSVSSRARRREEFTFSNIGELVTLDFVNNEIGRNLKGRKRDWIDLSSIDPHEYYMTEYLRGVLLSLANRVYVIPADFVESVDQWMLMSFKQVISEEHDQALSRDTQIALIMEIVGTWFKFPPRTEYRAALSRLLRGGDTENDDLSTRSPQAASCRTSSKFSRNIELGFDSTVCQISCRLVVSNLPIEMSILSTIKMSVVYGAVSPLPYPLPESLDESNTASHVVLHVFPMYSKDSLGVDVGPKVIVIEAAYADFLLRGEHRAAVIAHHRQCAPTTERMDFMGQARELRGEMEYQASGCIDLAVEVGGKLLEKVLRTISSCLRYESTKSGISLMFSGSVNKVFPSEYALRCEYSCEVIPWPDSDAIQSYAAALAKSQATIDELYFQTMDDYEDSGEDVAFEEQVQDLPQGINLNTSDQSTEKPRIWKHKLSIHSDISTGHGDVVDSGGDVQVEDSLSVNPTVTSKQQMHHKHVTVSKDIQTLIGLIAPDNMHREHKHHQQQIQPHHFQDNHAHTTHLHNATHATHQHQRVHHIEHKITTTNHHRNDRMSTTPVPANDPDEQFELSSCRYIHGSLISFHGRFLPEEMPIAEDSDRRGATSPLLQFMQVILVVTASLQGVERFPTTNINIEPEYLQYLFSSLDPPYITQYSNRGSGDPDDELDLEIQHMWKCILDDESLQQRIFSSACDHLNVNVSRELKRIEIKHAFDDSMLC